MEQPTKRETGMETQGYLGNSRVILNHFDAATQADIQHTALSYESEDETMGRSRGRQRSSSSTPLYSKQDIREQYCISERGLGALEAQRGGSAGGLFGCLAGAHPTSPCAAAARGSLLTVCVRRRVPSDENIHELCRRQPADYAPMPRYPRYPFEAAPAEVYRYDGDLECSYFRRRPRSLCGGPDPSRYTWLPADEESTRLERPRPIRAELDHRHSAEHLASVYPHGAPVCLAHPHPHALPLQLPPPPAMVQHEQPILHRPKHVSFARSHTLTSFDDAVVGIGSTSSCVSSSVPTAAASTSARLARSQERLLDGRKTCDPPPITRQPESCEPPRAIMEKLKRAPMKTQATQTEVCLGRKPVPSAQLTLSPRTIHRVKMVSQGAQTNGMLLFNGRKLMKSYSEAGGKFTADELEPPIDHEPLQRTQSEEPPRSPFIVKTPSPSPEFPTEEVEPEVNEEVEEEEIEPVAPVPQNDETASIPRSDHDSTDSETKSQKEIIIDFEPQIPSSPLKKKPLLKTSSDGEILLDKRRAERKAEDVVFLPTKNISSVSHDNICVEQPEQRTFVPYFQNSPIRHENIFKDLNNGHPIFSSVENDNETTSFRAQDSLDEEFHENLIYGELFRKQSSSTSDPEVHESHRSRNASNSPSPEEDGVVPTLHLLPEEKSSPFASTDSLANDLRDHSDGIWNESQATVLQADSGTENGTGLSASELSSTLSTLSPGSAMLLTPSSRRKHLLMLQHQQRSSMDTDALDEESQIEQTQAQTLARPCSPRLSKEPPTISLLPPPKALSKDKPLTPKQHRRIPVSPARIRRTLEHAQTALSDSALDQHQRMGNGSAIAVVPDLLLARTDSGRTNTDVSESTTTDDYCTANSGTDSSRRSGSYKGGNDRHHHHPVTQDGSSFESASSIYSITRGDMLGEDMVVPSFSPPPILEEASDAAPTPTPHINVSGRPVSPSGSSSSSGSYSLEGGGSCPDIAESRSSSAAKTNAANQRPPVPSPRHVPSVSDDERSVHYSSSGYYESPLEDESTSKTSRKNKDPREWTDEEKRKKKRGFTLEINKHQSTEDQKTSPADKHKSPHKDVEIVPLQAEKPKRTKARNRSPMQGGRRTSHAPHTIKRSPTAPTTSSTHAHIRTPTTHEDRPPIGTSAEDMNTAAAGSSDESSCGVCGDAQIQAQNQTSPRKIRKIRDPNRRKSTPRSPTSSRAKRRNGSGDDKPSSLPGSLPRRRPKHDSGEDNHSNTLTAKSNRLSPYRSPGGSPNNKRKSTKIASPESARLKALSAESLRSVSPGSDSVFYSDPSSHAAAPLTAEHQVHCLHCGKEVDIVTTDDPDKSASASSNNGQQPDIVQPPAGFADSPRQKHGRLYKKLEKRFRSEDRSHERRHHKYRADARAKSEERGKEECPRVKLRPMARSTDASLEQLRATGSSPSLLAGSPEAEDDCGIYADPYNKATWIYIGDHEEAHTWNKSDPAINVSSAIGSEETEIIRRNSAISTTSTDSEHEFKKRYQAITHRMVHRKSCLEMYKRQASKSFAHDLNIDDNDSLRKSLEELLKLMLMVWCRENQANKLISSKSNESDKTIVVRRESGEFGFRIHGSKPVVVSAIEPDTPAESSGLEVGDIVLAVNGVSVLDKSHSEVVKIAHAGSDVLTLEVARTCGVLSPPSSGGQESTSLYSGYLWKQGGHVSGNPTNKWIRRWFSLKKDNCLYSYKTDLDNQPVGAMMLINYDIERCDDEEPGAPTRPFRLCVRKQGVPTLHLAADTEAAANRWQSILKHAEERTRVADTWLEQTRRNLSLSPSALHKPDCFGYLNKLGSKWKTWSRRYCVLKDACIYFYQDANSKCSYGMACLHGYRVQQSAAGGKKHAFEILPSDSTQKHYYFHTESEMDRKRWLAALEYSIDRWLKVA